MDIVLDVHRRVRTGQVAHSPQTLASSHPTQYSTPAHFHRKSATSSPVLTRVVKSQNAVSTYSPEYCRQSSGSVGLDSTTLWSCYRVA